jgi:hypothetical protein
MFIPEVWKLFAFHAVIYSHVEHIKSAQLFDLINDAVPEDFYKIMTAHNITFHSKFCEMSVADAFSLIRELAERASKTADIARTDVVKGQPASELQRPLRVADAFYLINVLANGAHQTPEAVSTEASTNPSTEREHQHQIEFQRAIVFSGPSNKDAVVPITHLSQTAYER